VLANGSARDVKEAVKKQMEELVQKDRFILSCAGGMPPGVKTENIEALRNMVE
jgi:uroporphyrinogen-III decarboxylase